MSLCRLLQGARIAHCKALLAALATSALLLLFATSVSESWKQHHRSKLLQPRRSTEAPKPVRQLIKNFSSDLRLPTVSWNDSSRLAYARKVQQSDEFVIPAIRHILWRNESVSEYFAEQLRTWQRIHPNWTFVLWRDQDLVPFVAAHFPGLLDKFKSLPQQIFRVDMIRFMLLFKYGGTYADLDYKLVRNLDEFRRFHAVLTREPEAHSLHFLGMSWPVRPLVNSAFMMAAPGHIFFHFSVQQLKSRSLGGPIFFAGPVGITKIMEDYERLFPKANHALELIYVPPSFSFYPYRDNRLRNSRSSYQPTRISETKAACKSLLSSKENSTLRLRSNPNLIQFCNGTDNMDPITDMSHPVFAIHDLEKAESYYNNQGSKFFTEKLVDVRRVIPNLKLGQQFMSAFDRQSLQR